MFDSPYPVCVSLSQNGVTALYYACGRDHREVVTMLLDRGANINKVQYCNVIQCSTTSQATMWTASSLILKDDECDTKLFSLYRENRHPYTQHVKKDTYSQSSF